MYTEFLNLWKEEPSAPDPCDEQSHIANHLRDSRYIVVATTYEPNQCFPSVLPQYPNSSEPRGFRLEVGVCYRPLFVEFGKIRLKIEVSSYKLSGVITVVFRVRRENGWSC